MTGEMSKSEVTRENYPLYFAAADEVTNALGLKASVEPFDQYQGPYIRVGRGRIFLMQDDDDFTLRWYDDVKDAHSWGFLEGHDEIAVEAFRDLVEYGGYIVTRDMHGTVVTPEEIQAECERYMEVL